MATLPQSLTARTAGVPRPIRPGDVSADEWVKISDARMRRDMVDRVLDKWGQQQDEDRKLRRFVAIWLLGLMTVEVGVLFVAFLVLTYVPPSIEINQWLASSFVVGVFGQVAAMAFAVIGYLFPKTQTRRDALDVLDKI
jgi:hypothetical protein